MNRIRRTKNYKTDSQILTDLENEFFELLGLDESKHHKGRILLNRIIQNLIFKTDEVFNPNIKQSVPYN